MAENIGIKIVDVTVKNIQEYPPTCFMNKESVGFKKKYFWLKKRISRGLKIKQLYFENTTDCIGFIEYVPGEYAWRAVDAKGYMFIHCIWVYSNKNREKGYASILLNECIDDAKKLKKQGVAVITSDGPFIAGKELFVKNGFKSVALNETNACGKKQTFDLMVKTFTRYGLDLMKSVSDKKGHLSVTRYGFDLIKSVSDTDFNNCNPIRTPKFKHWEKELSKYQGLNIIYANQCPWTARGIKGLIETATKKGLKPKVIELKSADQAQNAPSVYATFNLVYNGRLLADHYISNHRFRNILTKELKK